MNNKTRLMKKADMLWFQKYLGPKCEICDRDAVQLHHFYYKSNYGHLRYEESNGISLCRGCHFVLHAQDPKKITEQIIEKKGNEWYETLKKKSKEKHESFQTIGYYRDIIKELT